jgi:hypothetical protein
VAEALPTLTPTVTPVMSPTPTPLALEAQDNVIQGGDPERVVTYPVNLQVVLPDGSSPRVWVVQRRAVRASEWNYDTEPGHGLVHQRDGRAPGDWHPLVGGQRGVV